MKIKKANVSDIGGQVSVQIKQRLKLFTLSRKSPIVLPWDTLWTYGSSMMEKIKEDTT